MSSSRRRVLGALPLLLLASAASADVIFDNGTPSGDGSWLSDSSGSDLVAYNEQAQDFQLQPGATTITDIHWWGVYAQENTPLDHTFTIRFFENDSGLPATAPSYEIEDIAATRTDSGLDQFGLDIYAYALDIAPLTLSANTTYWISILADTSNDSDDSWYWALSATTGTAAARTSDGADWIGLEHELAFYLTNDGVVPEPASMALLGIGLAGLALRRRAITK